QSHCSKRHPHWAPQQIRKIGKFIARPLAICSGDSPSRCCRWPTKPNWSQRGGIRDEGTHSPARRALMGIEIRSRHRPADRETVHSLFGHAVKWGVVTNNPVTAEPPRVSRTEIEILGPEQVATVLSALRGQRLYPIVVVGLATGMRRGEIVALR